MCARIGAAMPVAQIYSSTRRNNTIPIKPFDITLCALVFAASFIGILAGAFLALTK